MRMFALSLAIVACSAMAQNPFELESDRHYPTTHGNVLIKNAKLLTVTKGQIAKGDLLILNGKIAKVGGSIDAPAGVTVIDAAGKVVSPGIVDAHVHRGADAINEGTDSITADCRIADVLNPNSRTIYHAAASGETTGMLLHGSANCIGGQSQVIKFKYGLPAEEIKFPGAPQMIKFALGENVTRSGNAGNNAPGRFPRTRMGQAEVFRRAFTEARDYMAMWDAWEKSGKQGPPPRKDVRLDALADILRGKIWVQCHSYRGDEILMMVRMSQEFGFHIGAMQHALEAYKVAPELAKAGVGVSIFVDNWSFKIEGYDAIPYNAEICTKAGVNVSIHTDGTGGVTSLITDAAKVMRWGGLTEDQALSMVTINPARELGVDSKVGSLEVGKDGDVVIWDGHPLSVYSRVNETLIDGEVFFKRKDAFGVDPLSTIKPTLDKNAHRAPLNIPLSKAYVITGAMLYPVSEKPYVGSIRVEDGKIVDIGKSVSTSGARTINGRGLQIYPGFIDAGNSIGLNEVGPIGQMVDANEIGNMHADLVASTSVQMQSEHFPVARMGGVLTSFTMPGGGSIAGQGSVIQNGGWTTESIRLGVDMLCVNLGGGGGFFDGEAVDGCDLTDVDNENYMGGAAVRTAVEPAIALQGGGSLESLLKKALEYGNTVPTKHDLQMEALLPYAQGKKTIVFRVRSASQIRSAVDFIQKHNLKGILTGAADAWKETQLLKSSGVPVLITPGGKSTLGADIPANDWEPYDTVKATPALLAKAGVKFAFATNDNSGSFLLPIKVGESCAYGLSRDDALKALTQSAADILGVGDKLGTLEKGKLANLVISDGDPFELTSNIVGVFVGGRPMPLESKFTRLRNQWIQRLNDPK